ncbi:MAG: bifunctional non-ous end joining protein LigD [Actinomycetota bacterium]|nr:bifunctional non-ous end joining protein LigD [Actinomycetota bacterium]
MPRQTKTKTASKPKDYAAKRSFDKTPEPSPEVPGDVDPGVARPGETFVIHQHHATRLHYDLRLEMLNGKTPVLVSWAVPKNLPLVKGKMHLAVHVEDHPFDYGSFSGSIPAGNYGAGEVRIFDAGTYEVLEQEPGKLSFRLNGKRLHGVWHLFKTKDEDDKNWLVRLREWEGDPPEPLPDLKPMMATLKEEPFDDPKWIFEPKWDGVRALAVCQHDETMLLSRNSRDITKSYPELAKMHDRMVAIDAIVDGEIVALEGKRPSFERLQSRINLHNERDIAKAMHDIPITFIAFDLLYLDGKSQIAKPIEERKALLSELVVQSERVQVSPFLEESGTALFETASEMRLEGIVGKKLGSTYRPGRRIKEWLKIKAIHSGDLVIGGWTPGEGSRSKSFGAVLIGAYEGADLRFVGSVGTGFSDAMLKAIYPRLEELETDDCPFVDDPTNTRSSSFSKIIHNPRWVKPELVCRVEFRELTSAGRLRAPSFKGIRDDIDPKECTFEALEVEAGLA